MGRALAGLGLMVAGPWAIWLGYAHLIRPVWRNLALDYLDYVVLAAAFCLGVAGTFMLGTRVRNWSLGWRIAGVLGYAVALAIAMPMIALVSVCTTGDCL